MPSQHGRPVDDGSDDCGLHGFAGELSNRCSLIRPGNRSVPQAVTGNDQQDHGDRRRSGSVVRRGTHGLWAQSEGRRGQTEQPQRRPPSRRGGRPQLIEQDSDARCGRQDHQRKPMQPITVRPITGRGSFPARYSINQVGHSRKHNLSASTLPIRIQPIRRTGFPFGNTFMKSPALLIAATVALSAAFSSAQDDTRTAMPIQYPESKTVDVSDDYHGRVVADPYRWLEDVESDETAAWVAAQNKITQSYLENLPQRQAMRQKLETLWNYERYGLPEAQGESAASKTYLYTHNDGLQDQSVLYKTDSLEAERQVLIDPNKLSDDGTVALAGWVPTDDGDLVAYGLADGGSDWRTWKVRDVATGQDLDDVVRWVKFSGIAWMPDNSGFFYARYDEPVDGQAMTGTNENQKLYFHALGTNQSADRLVLQRPDQPKWGFSPEVTDDGRYLVIGNWKGTEPKTQVFLGDLRQDEVTVVPLIEGFDADYTFVASIDNTMYFLTDHEAPRRRLIAVDVDDPARENWREVIPQDDADVLESVSLFGETFYASYLKDARARVARFGIDGTARADLSLPGVGSVAGFGGKQDASETFFSFTNYVTPTSIYRLDLATGEVSLWRSPQVDFAVDDYLTEQLFVTGKDGTKVPMIITRHKDSQLDGRNRTLLYGYGGFNISLTPSYSPAIAGWLDSGGIYAVANMRGGGEYGRQWHEDGMRLKKQNVFDDFIAAAEHLIENNYTRSDRL